MNRNIVFHLGSNAPRLVEKGDFVVTLWEGWSDRPTHLDIRLRLTPLLRLKIEQPVELSDDGHKLTARGPRRELGDKAIVGQETGQYHSEDGSGPYPCESEYDRERAYESLAALDPAEVAQKIETAITAALALDPFAIVEGQQLLEYREYLVRKGEEFGYDPASIQQVLERLEPLVRSQVVAKAIDWDDRPKDPLWVLWGSWPQGSQGQRKAWEGLIAGADLTTTLATAEAGYQAAKAVYDAAQAERSKQSAERERQKKTGKAATLAKFKL